MKRDDIRQLMLRELAELAPEADLNALDPGADIREELDIDSFDFTRYLAALSRHFNRDIPDEDFARLTTLSGAEDYFSASE